MPGPPPTSPWRSPLGLSLLDARQLPPTREAWLAMVRAALDVDGTQARAAAELGVSHRQLTRWLAWLRDHDAPALAALPPTLGPRGNRVTKGAAEGEG